MEDNKNEPTEKIEKERFEDTENYHPETRVVNKIITYRRRNSFEPDPNTNGKTNRYTGPCIG